MYFNLWCLGDPCGSTVVFTRGQISSLRSQTGRPRPEGGASPWNKRNNTAKCMPKIQCLLYLSWTVLFFSKQCYRTLSWYISMNIFIKPNPDKPELNT